MARLNIVLRQGETFRRTIHWYEPLVDIDGEPILDADGNLQPDEDNPIDLTGYTGRMQVRSRYASDEVFLNLTTENGGITITGLEGKIEVLATDEETATLTRSGRYDLELESSGGDVTRLLEGKAKLSKEITRIEGS